MTSSFKVNKLYSLCSRVTEQKARLGGLFECYWVGSWRCSPHSYTICFFFSLPQLEWWSQKIEFNLHQLKFKKMATLGKAPSRQKCLDEKHQTGKLGFINGDHCVSLYFRYSKEWHSEWMQTIPWLFCQKDGTFGSIGYLESMTRSITWNRGFLPLLSRELCSAGKYEYISLDRLQADEIEQSRQHDFHLYAPTGFAIDMYIKPSAIKQQAPSRWANSWEQKGCCIWLDWLTPQHRLADTPGIGCLQSYGHNSVTWL